MAETGSNPGDAGPGAGQVTAAGVPVTQVSLGDRGTADLMERHILDVPDFPQPGILFKDLTPVFADGTTFRHVIDSIVGHYGPDSFDVVAGIEARGFVIASAIAYAVGVGVVPVRKAGKLPRPALSATYALEYGEATLEVHEDAFVMGQRVLVVDDVLATGGTAEATLDLVERAGGTVAGFSVLVELAALQGRQRLKDRPLHVLLSV